MPNPFQRLSNQRARATLPSQGGTPATKKPQQKGGAGSLAKLPPVLVGAEAIPSKGFATPRDFRPARRPLHGVENDADNQAPNPGAEQANSIARRNSAAVSAESQEDPREKIRKSILMGVKAHRLVAINPEGKSLADRVVDDLIDRAGNNADVLYQAEFIDKLARSINSVVTKHKTEVNAKREAESKTRTKAKSSGQSDNSDQMLALAFKLTINFDLQSVLNKSSKGVDDLINQQAEDAKVASDDWASGVRDRLGRVANAVNASLSGSFGMCECMVRNPEMRDSLVAASIKPSLRMLDKLFPQPPDLMQLPKYVNMAIALRNIAVRRAEMGDVTAARSIELNIIKRARELIEKDHQPDPVAWTITLLKECTNTSVRPGGA